MKKYPLMGQIVTVSAVLKIKRDFSMESNAPDREFIVEKLSEPRAGWVVKYGIVQEGNIKTEREDFGYSKYFDQTKTIRCLFVAFWPNRKPVPVPLDAVKLGGVPDCREMRFPTGEHGDKIREILRNDAKTIPRINGRFAKENSK